MKIRKYALFLLMNLVLVTNVSSADPKDKPGSKDHPLLTRYPNSRIASYEQNFNIAEMTVSQDAKGKPVRESIEGTVTKFRYFHNDKQRQPSAVEVIRNYQNAVKSIGGEILFERTPKPTNGGETTLHVQVKDKEFFVRVAPQIYSGPTQSYELTIVERAAMKQVVSANAMLDELKQKGFVTLYINFDTNRWDIKPVDQPTLGEIATMLRSTPDLKIAIEGHTDNIGSAEANKTLSENRAKSVMDALVAQGIAPARVTATGFGQEKPIADNRSEAGRAKNRRVELVKG